MARGIATRNYSPMKVGDRYGRLIAIGFHERIRRSTKWKYLCDCGKVCVIDCMSVKRGGTKSCGCLAREIWSANGTRRKKHGMKGRPEYTCWARLKTRCYKLDSPDYPDYGGRGITVCERWLSSFENFYADMGPRPSSSHSIDRIDNSLGYSPENCRWADDHQQCRNRRSNINVEYNGQVMCLKDASSLAGISYYTVRARIQKFGWSVEKALTAPKRMGGGRSRK